MFWRFLNLKSEVIYRGINIVHEWLIRNLNDEFNSFAGKFRFMHPWVKVSKQVLKFDSVNVWLRKLENKFLLWNKCSSELCMEASNCVNSVDEVLLSPFVISKSLWFFLEFDCFIDALVKVRFKFYQGPIYEHVDNHVYSECVHMLYKVLWHCSFRATTHVFKLKQPSKFLFKVKKFSFAIDKTY